MNEIGLSRIGPACPLQTAGEDLLFDRLKSLFFVYLMSVYYSPSIGRALGLGDTNIRPDMFVMVLAFAILIFTPRDLPQANRVEWIGVWLGLYWLSSLVTALVSLAFLGGQVAATIAPLTGVLKPLMVYLIFFLWVRGSSAIQRLEMVYMGLLLSMPLMLIAIGQFVNFPHVRDISNTYYGHIGLRGGTLVLQMMLGGRACSTFDGEPNQFGTFCIIALSCCTVAAIYIRKRSMLQCGLFLAFALTLFGLLLSWSRGAMGGLAAGLLLIAILTSPLRWMKIALGFLLLAVAVGPFLPLASTMRVIQLATLRNQHGAPIYSEREAIWRANVDLWKKDPLFGVMGVPVPAPDNLAIGLGSLTGISGLLMMSAALSSAFWMGLSQFRRWARIARERSDPELLARCALNLMVAVTTLAVVVNGASAPTVIEPRVLEPYWALVAIVTAPFAGLAGVAIRHTGSARSAAHDGMGVNAGIVQQNS